MRKDTRKKRYTTALPAVPVTPEMKKGISDLAEQAGISVSEMVRTAIELFLARNIGKTDINSR